MFQDLEQLWENREKTYILFKCQFLHHDDFTHFHKLIYTHSLFYLEMLYFNY